MPCFFYVLLEWSLAAERYNALLLRSMSTSGSQGSVIHPTSQKNSMLGLILVRTSFIVLDNERYRVG